MIQSVVAICLSSLTLATCLPAGAFVSDKGEVGASFGGFSASAGLGGILGNGAKGGLHAEAGTPQGHFAAAGLGGSVGDGNTSGGLYSGAVAPASIDGNGIKVRPTKSTGTLYDDIFNIPQSVLRSVTELLNNRAAGNKGHIATRNANASGSSASASVGVKPGNGNKNGLYDDIFNIPQSVLGAVNRLLNRF